MSEEIIKIENLKKTFNDNLEILKGISFSVKKGEVLSIIGPSGSGKSTLLRCISQLETVTDGSISICGLELVKNGVYAEKKVRHEIILKSGMVFQNFNLFPHYSVLKNIVDPQVQVLHKSKQDAEKTAIELLERMGLAQKKDNYPCELSGGQQQRLCIARALAVQPDVLLMDEPTSALDPISTSKIEDCVLQLKEKYTIIIVTHNMQQAVRISDKTVFFLLGEIIEDGDTEQIFSKPKIKKTEDYITGRFG